MDLSSFYDWVWGDKPYGRVQTPRPGTPNNPLPKKQPKKQPVKAKEKP